MKFHLLQTVEQKEFVGFVKQNVLKPNQKENFSVWSIEKSPKQDEIISEIEKMNQMTNQCQKLNQKLQSFLLKSFGVAEENANIIFYYDNYEDNILSFLQNLKEQNVEWIVYTEEQKSVWQRTFIENIILSYLELHQVKRLQQNTVSWQQYYSTPGSAYTHGMLTPQNIVVAHMQREQNPKIKNCFFLETEEQRKGALWSAFHQQVIASKDNPNSIYYPPEIKQDKDAISYKIDIYSLGVIFYQILVGKDIDESYEISLSELKKLQVTLKAEEKIINLLVLISKMIDPNPDKRCDLSALEEQIKEDYTKKSYIIQSQLEGEELELFKVLYDRNKISFIEFTKNLFLKTKEELHQNEKNSEYIMLLLYVLNEKERILSNSLLMQLNQKAWPAQLSEEPIQPLSRDLQRIYQVLIKDSVLLETFTGFIQINLNLYQFCETSQQKEEKHPSIPRILYSYLKLKSTSPWTETAISDQLKSFNDLFENVLRMFIVQQIEKYYGKQSSNPEILKLFICLIVLTNFEQTFKWDAKYNQYFAIKKLLADINNPEKNKIPDILAVLWREVKQAKNIHSPDPSED